MGGVQLKLRWVENAMSPKTMSCSFLCVCARGSQRIYTPGGETGFEIADEVQQCRWTTTDPF